MMRSWVESGAWLLMITAIGCGAELGGEGKNDGHLLPIATPSSTPTATPTATAIPNDIYYPSWSAIAPQRLLLHAYDTLQSPAQNGAALKSRLESTSAPLLPGDQLLIAGGNYQINAPIVVQAAGTIGAPIMIAAVAGEQVTITSSVSRSMHLGGTFLRLSGLRFAGGGVLLQHHDQLIVDQNHFDNITNSSALSSAQADRRNLYVIGNTIRNTLDEGMRFWRLHDSLIAANTITDTRRDGIFLTSVSSNNRLVANVIHDLKDNKYAPDPNYPPLNYNFPAIRWNGHGSTGSNLPVNIIERNIAYNIHDNCYQADGGADVVLQNNLAMNCANKGIDFSHGTQFNETPPGSNQWLAFASTVNRAWILNNTVINLVKGNGIGLKSWIGVDPVNNILQDRLYCIGNVVFTRPPSGGSGGFSIGLEHAGVLNTSMPGEIHHNIVYGKPVTHLPALYPYVSHYPAFGLSDFVGISLSYTITSVAQLLQDASPSLTSSFFFDFDTNGNGFGDPNFHPSDDLTGRGRKNPLEAGAIDLP